jgi:hypothetical protein
VLTKEGRGWNCGCSILQCCRYHLLRHRQCKDQRNETEKIHGKGRFRRVTCHPNNGKGPSPTVDPRDLEPRQKVCLIDTLEAVYGEEVQSEEILVLHHGSDFLTSDQTAALHGGSDDGHFG